MKLAIETDEVSKDGITEEGVFTIKSSAKAFAILSSGLYSNKYVAIIRELSCNAIDSHKEAGKTDVPFRIHLPNRLEPELSIQDYGVGLDNEGVMNVYTTYFESTKTDSNDYIGALGLGSKSPFSYTNNFTVTAIQDGVQRSYACHLNAAGIPSIAKMGDDVTTVECNGVEIKFAVKEEDFEKWDGAVRETLQWFEHQPIIVGRQIEIPKITYIDDGDVIEGIRIRDGGNRPIAIQGNVAYPIDPPLVEIPEDLHGLLNVPLVIKFDIGDLDVAASREELQYVPSTLKNITAKLESIFDEFANHAEKEILNGKTTWDKVVIADRLIREPVYKTVVRRVVEDINKTSRYQIEVRNGIVGIVVSKGAITTDITCHRLEGAKRYRSNDTYVKSRVPEELFGSPRGGTKIYIDDLKRGGGTRLKKAARGEQGEEYRLRSGTNIITIKVGEDKSQVRRLGQLFGGMKFARTSALPKVQYYRPNGGSYNREPGEKINFLVLGQVNVGYRRSDRAWRWEGTSESFDDYLTKQDYVYYVELKNKTVIRNGQAVDRNHFNNLIDNIKRSGLIDSDMSIVGLRRQNLDVLTPKCVNLFEYIEKRLKQFSARRLQRTNVYAAAFDHCDFDEDKLIKIVKLLPASCVFAKFVKKVNVGRTRNDEGVDTNTLLFAARWLYGSTDLYKGLDKEKARLEGMQLWDDVLARYSLLDHISNYQYGRLEINLIAEIAKYIKLVDTVSEMEDNSVTEMEES